LKPVSVDWYARPAASAEPVRSFLDETKRFLAGNVYGRMGGLDGVSGEPSAGAGAQTGAGWD